MVSDANLLKAKAPRKLTDYKHEIPLAYWRENTVGKLKSKRGELLLAIADMHGPILWARETGNTWHVERPEKQYINVGFLHKIDEYTLMPGQRKGLRTEDGKRRFECNDTVYLRDGWTLYVDDEAFAQYERDAQVERDLQAGQRKAAQTAELQDRLRKAESELAAVRAELGRL